MAFMTLDGNTIDIQIAGAAEQDPERGGELSRAFAGNLRSSTGSWRKRRWRYLHGIISQAAFDSLVSTYDDGDVHVLSGDCVGGASVNCIVQINGGDFRDDGAGGHVRDANIDLFEV